MTNSEDRINDIFERMAGNGLVSTSGRWIEQAVAQKNPRLTIELAYSQVFVHDVLDRLAITEFNLN